MENDFKDAEHYASTIRTIIIEEATNTVRDLGLNAKEVMGQVVQNASALNKFNFEGGVQGLT
jgi:hypothetical protein